VIFNLINPLWWLKLMVRLRYAHFFVVGATGVAINLALTAFFAELVFGRENYFPAYLIGLFVNLLYNFILHTIVTFKTKDKHAMRLMIFLGYSLVLTYVQAYLVKHITVWVGINWYLVVIASVIFFFSIITFLLFKFVLFQKDEGVGESQDPLIPLNPPVV
jgi:putative flippase GtrA